MSNIYFLCICEELSKPQQNTYKTFFLAENFIWPIKNDFGLVWKKCQLWTGCEQNSLFSFLKWLNEYIFVSFYPNPFHQLIREKLAFLGGNVDNIPKLLENEEWPTCMELFYAALSTVTEIAAILQETGLVAQEHMQITPVIFPTAHSNIIFL